MKTQINLFTLLMMMQFTLAAYSYGDATIEEAREYGASIASSYHFSCALNESGVRCWGRNDCGQTTVPPLKNPRLVTAGIFHICALDDEGVKCWGGSNESGQTTVPRLKNPKLVTAGNYHNCALDDDGVKCWGSNGSGQTTVPRLKNPKLVTAGQFQTCALDDEGVRCWGWEYDDKGKIRVPNLKTPKLVTLGFDYACASYDNGIRCWGRNDYGQTTVPALRNPKLVTIGQNHICALDDDGVKCWGSNAYGQTTVPTLKNPKLVTAGASHTCALDDNGIRCWGFNGDGQTTVPILKNPKLVTAGASYTCALDDDGVKCWGRNDYGQLNVPEELADSFFISPHQFIQNPNQFLSKILVHFPKSKASFLKETATLAVPLTPQKDTSPGIAYRQYLQILTLYELTLPIIEETTSQVVQEKVLPPYHEALSQLQTRMAIHSYLETELNPKTASLILSLSAAALQSGKIYIADASAHNDLEVMVQELGVMSTRLQGKNKMWKEDLEDVLKIYHTHHILLESLAESEKTRSFGMVLGKAQSSFEAQQ